MNKNARASDPKGRMTSITRRLHWYGIRKKLGRFLLLDLFLLVLLSVLWCADREYAALGRIEPDADRRFLVRQEAEAEGLAGENASGGSISPDQLKQLEKIGGRACIYRVTSGSGRVLLETSFFVPAVVICGLVLSLFVLQLLSILFSYYGENRAIRKILAPINEIALRADELSRLSFSEDKYQVIEEALENISPEQTDEPALSFNDADLAGIEAAMNNLLRRMRDSYRQQARFVNDASHELRTPIAVIQGYANMLDRWGKTDETVLEEGISAIKNESAHMNHLVEQLLFLARGDSGKTVLALEDISLTGMMREIYEESFMIDEKHHYRLLVPEGDEEIRTLADPGLFKQAVRILIDNAAKYTPEGDGIILSCGIEDSGCPYVQVQDEGIGMEPSELPHIFERFFRSDEVRASEGTGLGLSIAKWIVDKHKGHFEILSRKELGTRIRIVLPKTQNLHKNC